MTIISTDTQAHSFWGSFATAALPNVAASPNTDSKLRVGHTAYDSTTSELKVCTTATVGAAVWGKIGGFVHPPSTTNPTISSIGDTYFNTTAQRFFYRDSNNLWLSQSPGYLDWVDPAVAIGAFMSPGNGIPASSVRGRVFQKCNGAFGDWQIRLIALSIHHDDSLVVNFRWKLWQILPITAILTLPVYTGKRFFTQDLFTGGVPTAWAVANDDALGISVENISGGARNHITMNLEYRYEWLV